MVFVSLSLLQYVPFILAYITFALCKPAIHHHDELANVTNCVTCHEQVFELQVHYYSKTFSEYHEILYKQMLDIHRIFSEMIQCATLGSNKFEFTEIHDVSYGEDQICQWNDATKKKKKLDSSRFCYADNYDKYSHIAKFTLLYPSVTILNQNWYYLDNVLLLSTSPHSLLKNTFKICNFSLTVIVSVVMEIIAELFCCALVQTYRSLSLLKVTFLVGTSIIIIYCSGSIIFLLLYNTIALAIFCLCQNNKSSSFEKMENDDIQLCCDNDTSSFEQVENDDCSYFHCYLQHHNLNLDGKQFIYGKTALWKGYTVSNYSIFHVEMKEVLSATTVVIIVINGLYSQLELIEPNIEFCCNN